MLFLIVLPLMATASYLSKRDNTKYSKKSDEAKKQTIRYTKTKDNTTIAVPSIIKDNGLDINEQNLSFRLSMQKKEPTIVSEQVIKPQHFSGKILTSRIFKDIDCDMNLLPYSKLSLVTGIGISVKPPIRLEDTKKEKNSIKNKVVPYKKCKTLRSETEFSNSLPPQLSKLQLIEKRNKFLKYQALDSVLLDLFICQRLNEIIWMGVYYYSINYINFLSLSQIDTG